MHENPVHRFKLNVLGRVPVQCLSQINREDVQCAVRSPTKQLRSIKKSVWSSSTRQIDCVPQPCLAVRQVISGTADLATDRNQRRLFKIEPAKNSDRIKRLQRQLRLASHHFGKIKG